MSDGIDFLGRRRFAFFAALSCGRDTATATSRVNIGAVAGAKAAEQATSPANVSRRTMAYERQVGVALEP